MLSEKMDKTIDFMFDNARELNQKEMHLLLENINGSENCRAVVSVYDGTIPAHTVIEKLTEWLEENVIQIVIEKIKELQNNQSLTNMKLKV